MSSFTEDPWLQPHSLTQWEVKKPFVYYREPILDKDGNVKSTKDYTEEERKYRSFEVLEIPAGFVSDLTTIPRWLWSIWPPHDTYCKAAIVHDYMYQKAIGSKKEADLVWKESLGVLGIKGLKQKIFYWAVRFGGKGNYK